MDGGPQEGRVVVVDDDTLVRESIAEALRRAGFDVLPAASGAEALALLEQHRVDVLLTDLSMPGIDGQALLITRPGHLNHPCTFPGSKYIRQRPDNHDAGLRAPATRSPVHPA